MRRKAYLVFALFAVWLTVAMFVPHSGTNADAAPLSVNGNGPGGVGIADGTGTLRLWLQADRGITASPVATWTDYSGYNNHGFQNTAGNRPVRQSNVWNNLPSVRFDGSNDFIETPLNLNPTNASGYTVVLVQQMASLAVHNTFVQQLSGTGRGILGTLPSPNFSYYSFLGNNWRVAPSVLSTNTPYLAATTWTGGSSGTLVIYHNQTADATFAFTAESATGTWRFGANKTGTLSLNGDMGDVIVFQQVLNELQRILVDNYLSSKYNITMPIAANDHYDGDTPANGDFDQKVAGIGQFGGDQNLQAFSDGMGAVNRTFLSENGDWLLFGHRTATNDNTTTDIPTTGDWDGIDDVRWVRHWYVDVTDPSLNDGSVDIIFDFSEGGMNGGSLPNIPVSNYRLLKRAGSTGQFSDITTLSGATVVVVGDQVQFQGVDVAQLGSNFTLGSIDGAISPTAITTQNLGSQISQPTYLALILLLLVLLAITIKVVWRRIV